MLWSQLWRSEEGRPEEEGTVETLEAAGKSGTAGTTKRLRPPGSDESPDLEAATLPHTLSHTLPSAYSTCYSEMLLQVWLPYCSVPYLRHFSPTG